MGGGFLGRESTIGRGRHARVCPLKVGIRRRPRPRRTAPSLTISRAAASSNPSPDSPTPTARTESVGDPRPKRVPHMRPGIRMVVGSRAVRSRERFC